MLFTLVDLPGIFYYFDLAGQYSHDDFPEFTFIRVSLSGPTLQKVSGGPKLGRNDRFFRFFRKLFTLRIFGTRKYLKKVKGLLFRQISFFGPQRAKGTRPEKMAARQEGTR